MCANRYNLKATCYFLMFLGLVPLLGCRSGRHSQRETALLRAEILDLEDQYYALKARCEGAESQLQQMSGQGTIDQSGNPIIDEYFDESFGPSENAPCDCCPNGVHFGVRYSEPEIPQSPSTNRYGQPNGITRAKPNLRGLFGNRNPLFGGRFSNNSSQGKFENLLPLDFDVIIPDANSTEPLIESTVEINVDSAEGPLVDDGFKTDPLSMNSANQGFDNRANLSTERVAKIDINASRTRGENVDGKPGDDGIVVLVQPKSTRGNIVMAPGELTVSLIDPSAAGEKQRIGLWKFVPQELLLFETNAQSDESGYLLHLPWDRNIPQSDELMLFIRYSSPDGNRLETSSALTIQPPSADYSPDDPIINGWTKRDPKWDLESKNPESMIVERTKESLMDDRVSDAVDASRRGIPAIRASTTIDRPRWRPTR